MDIRHTTLTLVPASALLGVAPWARSSSPRIGAPCNATTTSQVGSLEPPSVSCLASMLLLYSRLTLSRAAVTGAAGAFSHRLECRWILTRCPLGLHGRGLSLPANVDYYAQSAMWCILIGPSHIVALTRLPP